MSCHLAQNEEEALNLLFDVSCLVSWHRMRRRHLTSCLMLVCLVTWHRMRRRHFNLLFEVSVSCHLAQNEEEAL